MVTDPEGHLAAGLHVNSEWDEVVRHVLQTTCQEVDSLQSVSEEHAVITLELLQDLLEQAVAPAYDGVMLHTDGSPCLSRHTPPAQGGTQILGVGTGGLALRAQAQSRRVHEVAVARSFGCVGSPAKGGRFFGIY